MGGLDFFLIAGIGGESQGFQGDHEGITGGIVHVGVSLDGRIPEDFPALFLHGGRIELRGVVDDAHVLPEIGHGIGVVRVKGQVSYRVGQVVQIVHNGFVQGLQHVLADQALDHIIAGHQNIPGIIAAGDIGVHAFVGIIGLVVDPAAVFLLKGAEHFLVDVFTPVVDVQGDALEALFSFSEGEERQDRQGQDQYGGKKLFHVTCSSFLFFLSFRYGIRLASTRMTVTTITISEDRAFTAGLNRFMEYTYMEMFCTSMPAVK